MMVTAFGFSLDLVEFDCKLLANSFTHWEDHALLFDYARTFKAAVERYGAHFQISQWEGGFLSRVCTCGMRDKPFVKTARGVTSLGWHVIESIDGGM